MPNEQKIVGHCAICEREMVAGPTINEHHLIPKTFKGRETITIHIVCHTKIHSVFTERELLTNYNTVEAIRAHPEMEKFIRWVAKKDPEFKDRNKTTKEKRGRRRR